MLEQVVGQAEHLSPEMQKDLARMMTLFLGAEELVADPAPEQDVSALRSQEAARYDSFASDADKRDT